MNSSAPSSEDRHRTAIRRTEYSRPIRLALEAQVLTRDRRLLDWGCGHGDDLERLKDQGFHCSGWDPHFRPDVDRRPSDVVNLGFILNVIEDPDERRAVLQQAWEHTKQVLLVAARPVSEARSESGRDWGDGIVTAIGTFQKFYDQVELRDWVETSLHTQAVSVEPGVVFVFRDAEKRRTFNANRFRRSKSRPTIRQADRLYEAHREQFDELFDFYSERGRAPKPGEILVADTLSEHTGTPRQAVHVLRRLYGRDELEEIRRSAAEDLLVFLALDRFGGRPKFGELPEAMRWDIRSHFSSYRKACEKADRFLFAVGNPLLIDAECRDSLIGKLTPTALYVHMSALEKLTDVLRVYEGCARALLGDVPEANILKLHRRKPKVSYLAYPDFDTVAHPELAMSFNVDLKEIVSVFTDYRDSENPPILHRKEAFVAPNYTSRPVFEELTREEEAAGLLNAPNIGTSRGWQARLRTAGLKIDGHHLLHVEIER